MRRPKAISKASKVKLFNRRAYNKDGVDLSHIRGFLELTPAQRLQAAQTFAQNVLRLRALNADA